MGVGRRRGGRPGSSAGIRGTPGHTGRTGRLADGEASVAMATVLVVEDQRKLRKLVRSYLEQAGFTVL